MVIKAYDESHGMCPILNSWNLDGLSWIALYMTYDDDKFSFYKEHIGNYGLISIY